MGAIKEHYHETLNNMHYEDYYSQTPEQAAKTARAETLKEIIKIIDARMDKATHPLLFIELEQTKFDCEELLNSIK